MPNVWVTAITIYMLVTLDDTPLSIGSMVSNIPFIEKSSIEI